MVAKKYNCAVCGKELKVIRKAVPLEGIVMNLVEPHECVVADESGLEVGHSEDKDLKTAPVPIDGEFRMVGAEIDLKAAEDKVAEAFKAFPFVKKLNKAMDIEPLPTGDRRPKQHTREELTTSTAPSTILSGAKGSAGSIKPDHELKEPKDE